MRFWAVVGVSLGLGCCPLAAQQALLASTQPSGSLHNATVASRLPRNAALAAETVASPLAAGLPASSPLFGVAVPQLSNAVCSQAVLPVRPAESDYAFSHLQFSAAALKSAFRHDNMVKMARNFVPGQPLPDAPSYVPLTKQEKFDMFIRGSHSGDFALSLLTDSLTAQATGTYPRFGGGMQGYGKRLGATVAGEESAAFFGGFLFPTLLHQDPRYFRSRQNAISDRLAYAASRVLIGRSDSGRSVINFSAILSQFAEAGFANAYLPYRNKSVSGTMENALAGLGAAAETDILNEFWPDIKEFFSRHTPETIRRKMNVFDPVFAR